MNNLINIWELKQEQKLIREEMLEANKGFCYASDNIKYYREKYYLLYNEYKKGSERTSH